MKILLIALMLMGCGSVEDALVPTEGTEVRVVPTPVEPPHTIAPEYEEFARDFEEDFGIKVTSNIIVVKNEGMWVTDRILGRCNYVANHIEMNEFLFTKAPIIQKFVLYHELAHCMMFLPHTAANDGTLTDPYTYSNSPWYYEQRWDWLVADLRSKYETKLGRN